jgi:hypothetical protein
MAPGVAPGVDEKPPKPAAEQRLPKPRKITQDEIAALRLQSVTVRKEAISLRPRGLPELLVAARMLDIDLIAQPQLVWLVDLCLACDYLPAGWEPVATEDMREMPNEGNSMLGLLGSPDNNNKKKGGAGEEPIVSWLPPLERLWYVATKNCPPPQFTHNMCSTVTERHPLHGFVRYVLGQQVE